MSTDDSASRNTDAPTGRTDEPTDQADASLLRGSTKIMGEATISAEASSLATAKVEIGDDDCITHLSIDLTEEDAKRLRDELTEQIAAGGDR